MEFITLARPYAYAAFNYATEINKVNEWEHQLKLTVATLLYKKIKYMLSSPDFTVNERVDNLINLISHDESKVSEKYKNFLKLLATNNRLILLPYVLKEFIDLKMQQEEIKHVTIVSAFSLSKNQFDKVFKKASKFFGNNIEATSIVDPSIIGGIKICCEDWIYDDTISSRLNKLTKALTA